MQNFSTLSHNEKISYLRGSHSSNITLPPTYFEPLLIAFDTEVDDVSFWTLTILIYQFAQRMHDNQQEVVPLLVKKLTYTKSSAVLDRVFWALTITSETSIPYLLNEVQNTANQTLKIRACWTFYRNNFVNAHLLEVLDYLSKVVVDTDRELRRVAFYAIIALLGQENIVSFDKQLIKTAIQQAFEEVMAITEEEYEKKRYIVFYNSLG